MINVIVCLSDLILKLKPLAVDSKNFSSLFIIYLFVHKCA